MLGSGSSDDEKVVTEQKASSDGGEKTVGHDLEAGQGGSTAISVQHIQVRQRLATSHPCRMACGLFFQSRCGTAIVGSFAAAFILLGVLGIALNKPLQSKIQNDVLGGGIIAVGAFLLVFLMIIKIAPFDLVKEMEDDLVALEEGVEQLRVENKRYSDANDEHHELNEQQLAIITQLKNDLSRLETFHAESMEALNGFVMQNAHLSRVAGGLTSLLTDFKDATKDRKNEVYTLVLGLGDIKSELEDANAKNTTLLEQNQTLFVRNNQLVEIRQQLLAKLQSIVSSLVDAPVMKELQKFLRTADALGEERVKVADGNTVLLRDFLKDQGIRGGDRGVAIDPLVKRLAGVLEQANVLEEKISAHHQEARSWGVDHESLVVQPAASKM